MTYLHSVPSERAAYELPTNNRTPEAPRRLFDAEYLNSVSTEQLLVDIGSVRYGHTILETGQHASGYLSKEGFLTNPTALREIASRIVQQFDGEYDFVVGPVNFGYMLASYCALVDNKPCSYVFLPHDGDEYVTGAGRMHRDFVIPTGKRALLVDDWAVKGETLAACREYLTASGNVVSGVAVIGVNPNVADDLQTQGVTTLLELPFSHYAPEDCTHCQAGEPVEYQGIRE